MHHSSKLTPLMILCLTLLSACQPAATEATSNLIAPSTLDSAEAYLAHGDQYAGIKQYDRAIEDYNQAIQLKPNYAEAYNNRGYSYYYGSKANLDQAIADYSQAILLRPDYAYAYNNRGAAFLANGFPEEAISDLNRALQLKPSFPQAHSDRGNAYLRVGQIFLAYQDFYQAKTISPFWMAILIGMPVLVFLLITGLTYRLLRRRGDG